MGTLRPHVAAVWLAAVLAACCDSSISIAVTPPPQQQPIITAVLDRAGARTLPTTAAAVGSSSSDNGQYFLGFNLNGVRGRVDSVGIASTTAQLLGGGGFLRYPGGSTANYWDWRSGWCVPNSSSILQYPSWCGQLGRNYSLEEFGRLLAGAGPAATAVWDLNLMTSSIAEQLSMLEAANALGMPVTHVELGK
jgi:hypothetical protein